NDAIELTWLHDLLAPTAKCPHWAFFMHALINHFAQKSPIVHEKVRVNAFAQTWLPRICSLPQPLQQIIKAARKYHLSLEALSYASETLDSILGISMGLTTHAGSQVWVSRLIPTTHHLPTTKKAQATTSINY
ncbi:hypothetical protein L208DRAFT_1293175, partial [Tricholoma matsutake]